MAGERGFLGGPDDQEPSVFLQWKGTDACFDFYCECGAHCHFDGDFAYFVQCPHCQVVWEMPCRMWPRRANKEDWDRAKVLDHDEDWETPEGRAIPVQSQIQDTIDRFPKILARLAE